MSFKVSSWSIRNPVPGILLFVLLTMAGLMGFAAMKVQAFPDMTLPVVTITASLPGASASHRGRGWEAVTEQAIDALARRGGPLAAVLWGRDAQSLKPMLGEVPWADSVHPSPLSASRGFFGSRPFSRVNALLEKQGGAPVDWRLP